MGCDIHCYAEVFVSGAWKKVDEIFPCPEWKKASSGKLLCDNPISDRNYSLFGFLADVRNVYNVPVLKGPRGLPEDVSKEVKLLSIEQISDSHSHSWLSLGELLSFDYDCKVNGGGAYSLRDLVGREYFSALKILSSLGTRRSVRIVFWFDN